MSTPNPHAELAALRQHALLMLRDVSAFVDTLNEALAKLPAPESPQLRLPLGRTH